ncbi:hypothetical protein BN3658_00442 [Coriobacteriaceae bacterium CHKCI002]|nr:hypothetical protein BN3658_00442 [Coriobacteriaceae bacterium CHKCI002]
MAKCEKCGGTGYVQDGHGRKIECDKCGGEGKKRDGKKGY